MGRYELRFAAGDAEVAEEQQAHLGHTVAQAREFAPSDPVPWGAVSVPLGSHPWCRGLPPDALWSELKRFTLLQIG